MQNIIIDGFNFSFIGAYIGYKDETDTDEVKLSKTLSVLDGMLNNISKTYSYTCLAISLCSRNYIIFFNFKKKNRDGVTHHL